MKNVYKKILYIVVLGIGIFSYSQVSATSLTGLDFSIVNPILSSGFAQIKSTNFGLGQSFGQSVIGKSISARFQVWSGFQYYASAKSFVATAQPGDSKITYSWNAPQTFLGATVGSYELGIGTTPGTYVFQNVGSSTTFVKPGLTNGVQYYAIIKALSPGGVVLSFSNVLITKPVSVVTPPSPGGGGGGGGPTNTGSVGNAAIIIKGIAYPGAQVTILKDGAVQAVTTADMGALFSITINNLVAAQYTFGVYATDSSGRKSSAYSFPMTLTDSVTAEIDNVFLAPTIGVDSSTVKKGDPIGIFGTAAPNAQVNIYVHSAQQFTEQVSASKVGAWFKQFDTSFLELGDHVTFSRQLKGTQVTDVSQSVGFTVGDTTIKENTTCGRSDMNCDKKINITDLSMLLFYWHKTPPASSKADINKDKIVDSKDFSILLYDWTG